MPLEHWFPNSQRPTVRLLVVLPQVARLDSALHCPAQTAYDIGRHGKGRHDLSSVSSDLGADAATGAADMSAECRYFGTTKPKT
jgi:hypothetical protein